VKPPHARDEDAGHQKHPDAMGRAAVLHGLQEVVPVPRPGEALDGSEKHHQQARGKSSRDADDRNEHPELPFQARSGLGSNVRLR